MVEHFYYVSVVELSRATRVVDGVGRGEALQQNDTVRAVEVRPQPLTLAIRVGGVQITAVRMLSGGDIPERAGGDFVMHRHRDQSNLAVILLLAKANVTSCSTDERPAILSEDFDYVLPRKRAAIAHCFEILIRSFRAEPTLNVRLDRIY